MSPTDNVSINSIPNSLGNVKYSIPTNAIGKSAENLKAMVESGEITLDEAFESLTDQYGTMPKGENPKVDVTFPKKISKNQNIMRYARNAAESGHLDEGMSDRQRKEILKGGMTYKVISDKSATDKAKGTSKENPQLKQVYVLLSALKDGENIIPVQFEIKKFVDDNNRLYLAVSLTKIETGVMGNTIPNNSQVSTNLLPISNVSIPELFAKINPKDKKGEILDYAVITSTYGRRFNNLQNLIDKSTIYYINEQKNRTDNWLKALGLHLPSAITNYGPINSIPNSLGNVKYSIPTNAIGKSREDLKAMVESGEITLDEAFEPLTDQYGTMPKGENHSWYSKRF